MKHFLFLTMIILSTACQQNQPHELFALQTEHMATAVNKAYKDFEQKVRETGYPLVGSDMLEFVKELSEHNIKLQTSNSVDEIKQLASTMVLLTQEKYSERIDTELVTQSTSKINSDSINAFKLNVQAFMISTINELFKEFISTFWLFDRVNSFVNAETSKIKRGDNFRAEVGITASASALKPRILMRPKGQEKYYELQVKKDSGMGIVSFKAMNLGKHTLEFKIEYPSNGWVQTMEVFHEYEVVK